MNRTVNLYETETLRTITGPAIRPGGLTLTQRALDYCRLPEGVRVLDVGCGSGATLAYLRSRKRIRAFGVDFSWKLLTEEDDPNLRSLRTQGRAEALPLKNDYFSALFCECVLSLLPDPAMAVAEYCRVLAPGGYLILSDLYARPRQGRKEESASLPLNCCLNGAVGRESIVDWITAAGFDLLFFEDHTDLLKQLAAQMVWQYGSLAAFREAAGGAECRGGSAIFAGRPGYYLMVARKGVL
jgi:ubiquinone/menaquinone biosynthesis C-methylase UbiE